MEARWYHRNIELIASLSSTRFVLSMQQVSIQTYPSPSCTACRQLPRNLADPKPDLRIPPSSTSRRVSSSLSSPQVCDKIAYLGILYSRNSSSLYVLTLTRRIV